jgi:ATP-dependent RNA/DNA helicase IGHMBP2
MASKYKRTFGKSEREQRNIMYKQAKSLSKDANDYEDHLIDKIFDNADVITCTLVGSTTRYLANRKFYTVIIDEAAQALEAATWIPISKGQKVILAGDPFQLPPTIKSKEAAKAGLQETLLEQCITKKMKVNLLDTQYRMNEQIMSFSNQQFYDGKLKADETVKSHSIDDKPMQFIDTAGCGFEEKKDKETLSLYNQGEIDLVNKLLEQHISIYNDEYSVGIISPYRQQVERIRDCVDKNYDYLPNVKIDTIDSFQGQERDVIIISLVRSNENAEIGFLKDYRRLNVALTRARKKLIVIGDSATLASDKFYGQFIDYIDSIDAYHSAYEFMYES